MSHSRWLISVIYIAASATPAGVFAQPAQTAPVITLQPSSISVNAGQSALFTVVATGTPPPTYQWRKNGTAIPGATGNTLNIPSATTLDSLGAYTVVVSNAAGSVTSNPATLTVNGNRLALTTQPTNVIVTSGTSAGFSAAVSANPPAMYQWLRNGVVIAGATATTHSIPNATAAQAGTYTFIAANSVGVLTSTPATLTIGVLPGPAITQQPFNGGVNAGDGTASFTVGANNATAFQWRKNGTNVSNGGPYSGATSPALNVTDPDYSAAGTYSAVVSNGNGSTTSDPATLTVFPVQVPTIATQPASRTANLGSSASFTVVPNPTGAPGFTYQWRKNGVVIANGTTETYTIASVSPADAGSYTVEVGNDPPAPATKVTSAPATLAIGVPLLITTQPASVAATERQAVSFTVVATGTPGPTYQWFKDTTTLQGATGATYTIPAVTLADAGSYRVVVTNSGGTVTSASAVLTVGVATARGRLANLSVLTSVSAADPSFIVGTVVGGGGTSGAKAVLVRAAGPSLAQFGVGNPLADPQLTLVKGGTATTNDDWGGTAALMAAFARVGAFGFVSGASKDAALLESALPLGDCTVQVGGVGNTAGSVIAEVYDATPSDDFGGGTPRLLNVSVRKPIAAGTSLTAGFVITGGPRAVLVRAVGPTLVMFNVPGVMNDPQIELFNKQGTRIASNDNWGGGGTLTGVYTSVGAFLLPAASRDSAIVETLQPGDYTAVVSGVGGAGGTALIEIYEVP